MNVEKEYISLLKTWCDRLIELQNQDEGDPRLYGGIFCPSCLMIHGRCHDALYPMMYLADRLKEEVYLNAAKRLFLWGGNLLCDDGSYYNDAQNDWAGITVFSVIALEHALEFHSGLLTKEEKGEWEERLRVTAEWVNKTITPQFDVNINYHAACAEALALTGTYFGRADYLRRADEMAEFCMDYISEEGLLFGEGKPRDERSPKGCRAVDIGYNVEESLASLLAYGRIRENEKVRKAVRRMLWVHLEFMNPDGGWDNTVGTRNYKWSYWGSRTSDGCQLAYGLLGEEEPVFSDASYRNVKLYERCTHNGLLYGGPDYFVHGELPCVHHTFCKAKALAALLDYGAVNVTPGILPSERLDPIKYWPCLDSYRMAAGGFIATVTAYDIEYQKGGHASGGTMTMLWNRGVGMILASSTVEYALVEPTNGQLSLKKRDHRPMTMRLETCEGHYFSSAYDDRAVFRNAVFSAESGSATLEAGGHLADRDRKHGTGSQGEARYEYYFHYHLEKAKTSVRACVTGCEVPVRWVIPVVGSQEAGCKKMGKFRYRIQGERGCAVLEFDREPDRICPVFFLNGGFEGWEVILNMSEGEECGFSVRPEGENE